MMRELPAVWRSRSPVAAAPSSTQASSAISTDPARLEPLSTCWTTCSQQRFDGWSTTLGGAGPYLCELKIDGLAIALERPLAASCDQGEKGEQQ